jgi:hypothetical protein
VIGNPLPVPITVRAQAEGGQLEIALWARARPIDAEWRREILARTSYEERVVEDASVPPGEARITQDGGPGFVLERVRTVHTSAGDVSERRTLRYPPTDRVVRVAPGYSFDSASGGVSAGVASESVTSESVASAEPTGSSAGPRPPRRQRASPSPGSTESRSSSPLPSGSAPRGTARER